MKICFISRSLFPVIGGSETYVYELAGGLSDLGHEVVIVTSDLSELGEEGHDYPFEVRRVPGLSDFNAARAGLRVLVPLFETLRSLSPDVIHVQNVLLGVAVSMIAEALDGPAIVFTDHNTPVPGDRRWISGIGCYDVELAVGEFLFRHGGHDVVVAPSRRFYEWAVARGAPSSTLRLIRHGVDTERFAPGPSSPEIRRALCPRDGAMLLLAPGRILRRKGLGTLLDALSHPLLASRDIHLAITTTTNTSEPHFFEEIRSRAHAPALRDRVTFLVDAFTPQQMPDVYRASDCVLFLSNAEGFGLVGIEALASGVPLVARPAPGIDEYLIHEKTGLAVGGDSPTEVARAVVRLHCDHALRSRLVESGRAHVVAEFNLSAQLRDLEGLYRELVTRRRTARLTARDSHVAVLSAAASEGWR